MFKKEQEHSLKIRFFFFKPGIKSLSTCLPASIEIVSPFSTTVQTAASHYAIQKCVRVLQSQCAWVDTQVTDNVNTKHRFMQKSWCTLVTKTKTETVTFFYFRLCTVELFVFILYFFVHVLFFSVLFCFRYAYHHSFNCCTVLLGFFVLFPYFMIIVVKCSLYNTRVILVIFKKLKLEIYNI